MPFVSQRAPLVLSTEMRSELEELSRSRTEARGRVERARMLLAYADGQTVSVIARSLKTNRPKVERCLNKALQLGARVALADLPGRGRRAQISEAARAWLVSVACQKPKDLGYTEELWTTRRLAAHARKHARVAGHPSLVRIGRGTVSKVLRAQPIRPHKITYYLERRDPEFDRKMADVLCVYRDIALWREAGAEPSPFFAVLSYDEKPGIQAIENTAPDLPPAPGRYTTFARDHEYRRHGTVSLLAGIDLLTGQVWGIVKDRHRSAEFIELLKLLDDRYPSTATLRLVLDNHSAHISKETRAFLATRPGRFDFVFTPKHGSWLNLIESFFGKLARTLLRGIRVNSKDELRQRIEQHLAELNESPVVFRWKYKMESVESLAAVQS